MNCESTSGGVTVAATTNAPTMKQGRASFTTSGARTPALDVPDQLQVVERFFNGSRGG